MVMKIASAALLVMTIIYIIVIIRHTTNMDNKIDEADDVYLKCYSGCLEQCDSQKRGYAFCELKCETDCFQSK